jgi:enoyl-CoA hydratase/carnithine racemase
MTEQAGRVQVWTDGGIGRIHMNRLDKRNAIDIEMADALRKGIESLESDRVRTAILSSAGNVFCSGADVEELKSYRPGYKEREVPSISVIKLLAATPLLIAAAVQGPAVGAGVTILCCCPVVVCTPSAWFYLPESELGLFPTGVAAMLERVTTARVAMSMALGRRMSAAEAERSGLVTEVVERDHYIERASELIGAAGNDSAVLDPAREWWRTITERPVEVLASASKLRRTSEPFSS